jgi:hypothetical protein
VPVREASELERCAAECEVNAARFVDSRSLGDQARSFNGRASDLQPPTQARLRLFGGTRRFSLIG